MFPLAYRGWAVAGYTAGGTKGTEPIDPVAFDIEAEDFDEANAPDGFDDLNRDDPGAEVDPSYAFVPVAALPDMQGRNTVDGPHWLGPRENHAVSADIMRTSLLGADTVDVGGGSATGGDGRGVTKVGLILPSASLAVGIGPLGGSFGMSPSFGLVDFEDMNGDGYPDVVTPGNVHFTEQRGAYKSSSTSVALSRANQDLTFSASGGLSVDLVDIKGNSKGKTNAAGSGPSAGKGGDADDSNGGVGIGGGLSGSWTSPAGGADGVPADQSSGKSEIPAESAGGAEIQTALADVNADGLPDRVFTTGDGVFAHYNVGYGFTPQAVRLTGGGFQSMESASGNASIGFTTPWAEFGGGVSFNWNYDQARYTWLDVNGDGILDQVRKVEGGEPPMVAFGTGSGVLPPVVYGDVESASGTLVPPGQQVTFDQSSGIGGSFDFTVYVGPLCLVACYLIINPGASYQNTVSSTRINLEDVDGDGAADSVSTTDDDELWVRRNNVATTNLLEEVRNPLGGIISLAYDRYGNTVEHPDSLWALSRVTVDDGRPDPRGTDLQTTTYGYSNLAYDRVHRQSLGFADVVARQLETLPGGATPVGEPLRSTLTEYHNENVFVAGLERTVTTSAPDGTTLRRAETTWAFRDVGAVGKDFDVLAEVTPTVLEGIGDVTSVASRGRSLAPLATSVLENSYEGGAIVESTTQRFTYDGLGNIVRHEDDGEPDDSRDNLVATYDYSDCDPGDDPDLDLSASTMTNGVKYPQGCLGPVQRPSKIWSPKLCPTWVSLPVAVRVTNGQEGDGEVVYRDRDGRGSLCDNASMTRLAESIDGTSPTPASEPDPPPDPAPEEECPEEGLAVTLLTYDSWGTYNRIVYPPNADCTRYAVSYVFDPDRHSDVGSVTEYDLMDDADVDRFMDGTGVPDESLTDPGIRVGLTSSATYDPLAGRVASRTDANGNTVRYTYDSLGRIRSIGSPRPEDVEPLVTFEYRPSAPGYGYAVARHLDIFNRDDHVDTIDTYTFADGTGRVTQTKRDATLFVGPGTAPVEGRTVSGATAYDALGRAYEQYYPTADTQAAATTFESVLSTVAPERTVWDLRDRPLSVTAPGERATTYAYGAEAVGGTGPTYATTTATAPNSRATTTYTDVRGVERASKDQPVGLPARLSVFDHDAFGQMVGVTDHAGNRTSHTYDLMGRRTSTDTPDGGLVEFGFDPEGKLVSKTTPNLRADDTSIRYAYELGRLTAIDYPGDDIDVTYRYGEKGDGVNGAGRVVREEDGSRIVTNEYAAAGTLSSQVAEMKFHDWFNPGTDKSRFRWTTEWDHDGLGRLASMTYPDGEELFYDYDAGGRVRNVVGEEDGLRRVLVGVDAEGDPIYEDQPYTWVYDYLVDRQYDEFLDTRWEQVGNGVTTQYTFDANTRWLSNQQTISPNRNVTDPAYKEIQDLRYSYDLVGNPTEYRNDVPPAIPNQFGGTTVTQYRYDALERLTGSSGIYSLAEKRHQRHELSLSYDLNGNVTSKSQYDATVKKPMPAAPTSAGPLKGELPNADTTYSFTRTYGGERAHQASSDVATQNLKASNDDGTWVYDRNGNLTGILEAAPDKWVRRLEWDAADRMTMVDDDGSTTEYAYDDTGQRTIERGPNGGETAFVNPWVTIRNKNEMFKHVFVDDTRLATQRDDGEYEELKRYFMHADLQGSTNMVTDHRGNTFQHHEYFASGEVWIDEKSTIYRSPYQYGGGYVDDARDMINFGARWYDQDRELFTSPDPVLVEDPSAITQRPALATAYAYAGSNPVTNVDPGGDEFFTARSAKAVAARYDLERRFIAEHPKFAATLPDTIDSRLPKSWIRRGLTVDPKKDRRQVLSELLDSKPIVEIDLSKGTVSFSFGIGKQFTFPRKGQKWVAATAPTGAPPTAGATAPVRSGVRIGTRAQVLAAQAQAQPAAQAQADTAPSRTWKPARPAGVPRGDQ
jgi:RHS repeat-associated protein